MKIQDSWHLTLQGQFGEVLGVKESSLSLLNTTSQLFLTFGQDWPEEGKKEKKKKHGNTKAEIQEGDLNMRLLADSQEKGLGELPTPGTGLTGISISLHWGWVGGQEALTSCWAQSREAGQRGDPLIWMNCQEMR